MIRIGVGGWAFEPWRGLFYPDRLPHRRELEYASGQLSSIEINSTFYGSKTPESFAKWREETPDGFVFSVKGPRFATSRRQLSQSGPSIERFFSSGVLELGPKLGPVNWQLPPTKQLDLDDIAAFLGLLPRSLDGLPIRHAIEVRHESFRSADFVRLMREQGAAIVWAADGRYPTLAEHTAPFAYLRLMGTVDEEISGYAPSDLDSWVRRIKRHAAGQTDAEVPPLDPDRGPVPGDVFVYVISGAKRRNPAAARALIERFG